MSKTTALVVGAGWAGLSAAVKLAEAGLNVTLLEAAPNAGGRARGIHFGDDRVDNGQHILIGAYQHTLKLLKTIGLTETEIFHRSKNRLLIHDLIAQKTALDLQLPNLFPPLHLITAILLEKNLPMKDRVRALRFCRAVQALDFQIVEDISVLELLKTHFQTPLLIKNLWEPLALATLSTPIEIASAQVFLKVLHDAFTKHMQDSDFLFAKRDLSEVLPNPAISYLEKNGGDIVYHQRVNRLLIENKQCVGVETLKKTFKADYVVLATPPDITASILENTQRLESAEMLINKLKAFSYQPITTIYLRYPIPANLPYHMVGALNGESQWIFDRAFSNQADILSVVITGPKHDMQDRVDVSIADDGLDNTLVQKVSREISTIFPHLAEPLQFKVVTEKRAAFTCMINVNAKRPDNVTSIPNLFLAGDYTNTGYPATLEGAVISGFAVSSLICFNLDMIS